MPRPINIAIDGYSSTGKSTLARQLAAELGYRYIDSGAMYRGVTLYALRKGFLKDREVSSDLIGHLKNIELKFQHMTGKQRSELYLNGENVESEIREMKVARHVSPVAAVPEVRTFLVNQQKKMAEDGGVVMDGRDIGTVVLPGAELKIFMTAHDNIRAKRRYNELEGQGKKVSLKEVKANLRQRDLQDSTREDSPLTQAPDAYLLDNSEMSMEEQLRLALTWVREVEEHC